MDICHPHFTQPRVVNADFDDVDDDFRQLGYSSGKVLDSLTLTAVTDDWKIFSPVTPEITQDGQPAPSAASQRSSFDAKLSEHHEPPLGAAVPLGEIDVEADPLPPQSSQSQDEEASVHVNTQTLDPTPKTDREATWAVEVADDNIPPHERHASLDSFLSDNSAFNARMARHLAPSDISESEPSQDTSVWSSIGSALDDGDGDGDYKLSGDTEPAGVWSRPWAPQE